MFVVSGHGILCSIGLCECTAWPPTPGGAQVDSSSEAAVEEEVA